MIRRRVTTLLSALIIGAAAAGPALAETSNATRPTLPPVGNDTPLGDDRQVEGVGGAVPGVGTATAKITGVRLWAPDLDVRVLDADMLSTLDHVRAGMTDDLSRGYFAAASVNLGDDAAGRVASELGLPMSVPHPAYQAESRGGEHLEQFHQFPVLLPATDTPIGSVNWQEMADGPSDLLNWLCAKAHPDCDVGSGGPLGGTNALGLAQGSILEGVLEPGRVHSRMTAAGASSSANSSLRELVMMSGLSTLYDAGLGDLSADVGEDSTLGFTKGLKIESVEAIRLSALLDLMGLSPDQIPDPVLAGMLDSLGVSPASLLAGAKSIPTVADLYNGLYATIDDVSAAITAGATCALLDDGRLEAWADEAAQYGVSAPDCLGLASLQTFLDALEQVGEDVVDAIHGAVQDAPLLEMENLWASAAAMASVGPDGMPEWGSDIDGGISNILVGEQPIGGVDVNDPAAQWNGLEEAVNHQMNALFVEYLGPEFADLVRVRLVPELVDEQDVDGDYATARARLVLASVMVDIPDIDPAAVLANLQAEAEEDIAATVETLFGVLGSGLPSLPDTGGVTDTPRLRLASSSGGGSEAGVLGQVVPGQSLTLTVGEFDVEVEHTRPGVKIPCQEACDSSKRVIRDFDYDRARFVPGTAGGTPDGKLPRTGGPGTTPIAVAAILGTAAWGLGRLNRRSAPMHLE